MKRKQILCLLISILVLWNFSQPIWAKENLALTPEDIDKRVQDYIKERESSTSAVSLGFFKDGKILYKKHYGYINQERKIPASEEAVYEWGSVSKVLIWVSIMQLAEEGKLHLEDNIEDHLPKDFLRNLSFKKKIRIMDLMNHQAGFQEYIYSLEYKPGERIPSLGHILKTYQPTQIYAPSSVCAYSNWSSALAAYLVEEVSGQEFYQYVNEHIFAPLDMKQTSIKPDWSDNPFVEKARRKSRSYIYTIEEKEALGPCLSYIGLYPAGSCTGTLEDFLTFASQFTSSKSPLFKKASTLERFISPSLFYKGTKVGRIHHGLWARDCKITLLGHGGNTNGYSSSLWFDPLSKSGYVVMTNEQGETSYNYGLGELFYGKKALPHNLPRIYRESIIPKEPLPRVLVPI